MIFMWSSLKVISIGTEAINTDRLFTKKDADDRLKNRIKNKQIQSDYGEPVYENIDAVNNSASSCLFQIRLVNFQL